MAKNISVAGRRKVTVMMCFHELCLNVLLEDILTTHIHFSMFLQVPCLRRIMLEKNGNKRGIDGSRGGVFMHCKAGYPRLSVPVCSSCVLFVLKMKWEPSRCTKQSILRDGFTPFNFKV